MATNEVAKERNELIETKYGFAWGPLVVERDISDPKFGYVLSVYTGYSCLEIRTSAKGRVLQVTQRAPNEYQREQWQLMQD